LKLNCYFLDAALTTEEQHEVAALMACDINFIRVPHVLPEQTEIRTEEQLLIDEDFAANALRRVHIHKDSGRRCLFVVPADLRWFHAFLGAIHRLTGFFPYSVQTAAHRKGLGVSGSLEILDMQKAME
jgi:hypothetical protein